MHPSVLTEPGGPGFAEPVAEGADLSARVREVVIQLTRLVQRAAIYPAGHPTVRLALAPFFDALQRLPAHERLLIVVLRDRLMVSAGANPPREHQSRWLAGQFHARGVASLLLEDTVDAEELLAFARWLGGPAHGTDRPASPEGLTIGWVDYSTVAFDAQAGGETDNTPRALAAWQRIAATLLSPNVAPLSSDSPPIRPTSSGPSGRSSRRRKGSAWRSRRNG